MNVAKIEGHLTVVEALIRMGANIEAKDEVHARMHTRTRTHTHAHTARTCVGVGGWTGGKH